MATGPTPKKANVAIKIRDNLVERNLYRRTKLRTAEPRLRFTKSFERFVLALSKAIKMLDVTNLLGVGWNVVKDILKRHLHRRFAKPSLDSMDEEWVMLSNYSRNEAIEDC